METVAAKVEVRPSGPEVGNGLFATADMAKRDFIAEYTGIKIPTVLADASTSRYLFELDKDWTIDGSPLSNLARYINHSCDPNAEVEIENGRIMIHAIKNIGRGEEITIDYDTEYFEEFIKPVGCKCKSCTRAFSR